MIESDNKLKPKPLGLFPDMDAALKISCRSKTMKQCCGKKSRDYGF
jgi:hypothetical protein